jgi:hypothetical protein
MTVESWLAAAIADAERRGLTGLKPILETLARSTSALREADRRAWEEREIAQRDDRKRGRES